jgi:two-component system chemotaxis sensor kinase CheA
MASEEKESVRKDFLSESEEILQQLTADLQMLESSLRKNHVRPELINKIFREFHSLKGISGMLGFDHISGFTHELETMLDRMRLGKMPLTANTIDLLYQSLDMLNRLIAEISGGGRQHPDTEPLLRSIREAMVEEAVNSEAPGFPMLDLDEQTVRSFTEYEEHRLRENIKNDVNLLSVRLVLDNSTFDRELHKISEVLQSTGELISTLPSFDPGAGADKMIFRLLVATHETEESLRQKLHWAHPEISDLRKRSPSRSLPQLIDSETAETTDEMSLKSLSPTVRVDIHKLDEVINVIGELVITKAMLMNISREISSTESASRIGTNISRLALDLEKKLNDLQRNVIETRLVPIGYIYTKLGRIIKKLSRETNKKVELLFFGEDTELDKIMIEELADPLMHIIRNAIDHGIESPEERKRQGKSEAGIIKISAFQRGNNVVIQVQDDGRGIQIHRIREHAIKRGLLPKDRQLDMKECIDLIFTPGFSSSEAVTELSGRGVGLDVVKRNIAELKGSISVYSQEGSGALFEITLPITLAIIQALLVKINGVKYAIPLSSVEETVCISSEEIQTVDRKEVYYLRDRTLPLIRVSDAFKLPGQFHSDRLYLVIVRVNDQPMGLAVDELAGQQEIVIKPMGERLRNIPGIAGATEIGDKKPILVIDAESLVEEVTHGNIHANS